jgi:ribosomal protein S12 methylthiotransferase accessory factor
MAEAEESAAATAAATLVEQIRAVLDQPLEESALLGHVVTVDPASGRPSLHRFIPLPWCPVCGGAAAMAASSAAEPLFDATAPAALLAQLAGWVDRRTGIVSRIAVDHGDAPVTMTVAPPYIQTADGELRQLPIGWGKGLTLSGAILSTVGETIERYSASLPDPARIVWKRVEELEGDVMAPGPLYSPEQYARVGFPYVPFDPEVGHPWIAGRWMGSGDPVWVPAVFAYLSLTIRREHQIAQGTSNGLAAGRDFEDAARRAAMELVERDAFLATWMTGRPGRRIVLDDSLDSELRSVLNAVAGFGAQVELYLLDAAACGTAILALALGDGVEYPGSTIGIGADLDPAVAVRQAILELGQTGPHLRRLMRTGTAMAPSAHAEVREMIDHAAFYFPTDRARAFDRIRSGGESITLHEVVAAQTGTPALRIALVDVTSPDVATGPFRVVRAVSPDLQPLTYGYGFDRPPVARIQRMGVASEAPPIHPIW